MTNNEGGFDYSKLAREGEIKKNRRKSRPIAPTRSQTLKSEAPDQERFQGDLRDAMSGSVRRMVHGHEVTLPKTAQSEMQGTLDIGVTNRDETRSLPLTDQLIEQSLGGYQDRHTLRKAQKQKGAITDSHVKTAQKKTEK